LPSNGMLAIVSLVRGSAMTLAVTISRRSWDW
jgi:hypothetical protein